MVLVTRLIPQKKNPRRCNVHLDGHFAFACDAETIERFGLKVGEPIAGEDLRALEYGQVKQECFNKAAHLLTLRPHSRAELFAKLRRQEWADGVVEAVVDDLTHMGYLNDADFARAKARNSIEQKRHGKRRAFLELIRAGVDGDVANQAVAEVYGQSDAKQIALELAEKYAPRLARFDRQTARRRLAGMLARRGYESDLIRNVLEKLKPGDAGSGVGREDFTS